MLCYVMLVLFVIGYSNYYRMRVFRTCVLMHACIYVCVYACMYDYLMRVIVHRGFKILQGHVQISSKFRQPLPGLQQSVSFGLYTHLTHRRTEHLNPVDSTYVDDTIKDVGELIPEKSRKEMCE